MKKNDIFKLSEQKYLITMFSSKDANTQEELARIDAKYKVFAIDFHQNSFDNTPSIIFLGSDTNMNLKFIQRSNIYNSPSILIIKKVKESLYKQDSMIQNLDILNQINTEIKEL
ncbi:MAG: hypothetical protein PHX13_08525 [Thiovulaceae bacterium]|nr:hypothetical protein [Sulfurimonadaceae bacterium]